MNVSLTPELEEYIAQLVEEGRYRSASEVVRMAVRTLQDQEEERRIRLQALTDAIDTGLGQLAAGDRVAADEVFERILEGLGHSEAA
jgi:antitoxin ParD1/3/4